MLKVRLLGVFLFLLGLFAACLGGYFIYKDKYRQDNREFVTATIVDVNIDIIYNDLNEEIRSEETVIVEFYIEDELVTSELSSFNLKYKIGDKIDIYYYPDNYSVVHSVEAIPFAEIVAVILGFIFILLGCYTMFAKNPKVKVVN